MKNTCIFGGVVAATLSTLGTAQAAIITIPTDLSPGDQYRLVFVTESLRDANSSNIADYNQFVTNDVVGSALEASLTSNGLATTWTALVSTETVDARTNTNTDPTPSGNTGVPIYLIDGNRIADNYDDLWGDMVFTAIDRTPFDNIVTGELHTGTRSDGLGLNGFELGNSVRTLVSSGTSSQSVIDITNGGVWIERSVNIRNDLDNLYGISDILTVNANSVPEPSNIIALGLLTTLSIGTGFKRKKK